MQESGLVEIIPLMCTSDYLGADILSFPIPSPLWEHGWGWLQWLRAWQQAAPLSPSWFPQGSPWGQPEWLDGCDFLVY